MACSKYEYVKQFENHQTIIPQTYMVVRLDGKGFTKFTKSHDFEKPNDKNGLDLMNRCAQRVMEEYNEIFMAYGQSDEYSFVLRKDASLYQRRLEKIISCLTSSFSSSYVFYFKQYFKNKDLIDPPIFDGRCVVYPNLKVLRDYLSWRQADCHINNLYNTCFWCLVSKGKQTNQQAEKRLKDTFSKEKNQILFDEFNINYNEVDNQFKKGSILIRDQILKEKHQKDKNQQEEEKSIKFENSGELHDDSQLSKKSENQEKFQQNENYKNVENSEKKQVSENLQEKQKKKEEKEMKRKMKQVIVILHEDLIQDDFWNNYRDRLDI